MTTDLEAGQLESLRRGLNLILQTDGLPRKVVKLVRRMLGLLEDETKIPNYIAESIQKMIESRVQTPEQAAVKLTRKAHAPRKKRPVLGSGYGRGTPPREKSGGDRRLREMADQLMERVQKAVQRRRGGRL
ncbi:MAG: hypothetical protein V3U30_04135 [Thermoplasmata archaeon]